MALPAGRTHRSPAGAAGGLSVSTAPGSTLGPGHRIGSRLTPGSRRPWLVLLAVALVAASCQSPPPEVENFADISQAGPVIEPDPSGTSATLRVTTSIEAVCAVAFGDTENLGRLATDQDMGAAGHRDHQVTLGGLEPDTEYFYRLQGVGVDGRLYRSELLRFRTPPASQALPGRNVATGATVVDVSSEFSDSFRAGNAVDGDPATEWSSAGDGDDAYLVIDLGRAVDVVAVGFQTRSMSDGTAATTTFTVTVDGVESFGPFPAGRNEVAFTGRIIRFDVETSTGGNTGATEVEVLEDA